MAEDPKTRLRIHIGNISPKLKESASVFQDRLSRFGNVVSPLDFHTKPVGDFHFAYVEMELTQAEYKKLKAAFNGMLYMGRKLTLDVAKKPFEQAWAQDHGRPNTNSKDIAKQSGVAAARDRRIAESQASTTRNSISGSPIVKTSIASHSSSMGYMKSAHTFNDMSGNTKHKSPSHSLVGAKSYGSTLVPKGPFSQQYSRTSGGGEVVKGRERKTPRPQAHFIRREQTMRILINGELKQIKCYKTKLWGFEKNKTVKDLTFQYQNGAWTSGDGHVVERMTRKVPVVACGIDGDQAAEYGQMSREDEKVPAEDATFEEEKDKNAAVLAKLFQGHDFDKKIDLEDEDASDEDKVTYDSKGRKRVERFDYEANGGLEKEDSDDDEAVTFDVVEQYRSTAERPQEEVYYSESDSGNELDMDALQQQYTTEAIKSKYDEEHDQESSGEFVSAEGSPEVNEEQAKKDEEEEVEEKEAEEEDEEEEEEEDEEEEEEEEEEEKEVEEAEEEEAEKTGTTESLRSLFNQEAPSGFGFAIDEDDIDQDAEEQQEKERQELLKQIKEKQEKEGQTVYASKLPGKKFGLFWSHFESPFLQTQTQLSKIGYVGEAVRLPGEEEEEAIREREEGQEDAYERWFWSVRGDYGRECKRRRRDVIRSMRKKKTSRAAV